MRIKLDENLPLALGRMLTVLGHDVSTVPEEGLSGRNDSAIWEAVKEERRFLITQDLDFSNIQQFAPGTHHGLLLLRLKEPSRLALVQRVKVLFELENVEMWAGSFVVATERKVRIRRPPAP